MGSTKRALFRTVSGHCLLFRVCKVMVEWETLLCLWEILSRHGTGYSDWGFIWFTTVPEKCGGSLMFMVLCESVSIIVQQDATMYILLYFCELLYRSRVVTPPIIRSTYNCNYSIWHWSNFGKRSVSSQPKMRGMDPSLLPSAIAECSRDGSIALIFSWLHTLHFPKFDQCQML